MKKRQNIERDEIRSEYDFTKGRVERGKFYERARQAKALRTLDSDLVSEFQDNEAVNHALREYLRMKREKV